MTPWFSPMDSLYWRDRTCQHLISAGGTWSYGRRLSAYYEFETFRPTHTVIEQLHIVNMSPSSWHMWYTDEAREHVLPGWMPHRWTRTRSWIAHTFHDDWPTKEHWGDKIHTNSDLKKKHIIPEKLRQRTQVSAYFSPLNDLKKWEEKGCQLLRNCCPKETTPCPMSFFLPVKAEKAGTKREKMESSFLPLAWKRENGFRFPSSPERTRRAPVFLPLPLTFLVFSVLPFPLFTVCFFCPKSRVIDYFDYTVLLLHSSNPPINPKKNPKLLPTTMATPFSG